MWRGRVGLLRYWKQGLHLGTSGPNHYYNHIRTYSYRRVTAIFIHRFLYRNTAVVRPSGMMKLTRLRKRVVEVSGGVEEGGVPGTVLAARRMNVFHMLSVSSNPVPPNHKTEPKMLGDGAELPSREMPMPSITFLPPDLSLIHISEPTRPY